MVFIFGIENRREVAEALPQFVTLDSYKDEKKKGIKGGNNIHAHAPYPYFWVKSTFCQGTVTVTQRLEPLFPSFRVLKGEALGPTSGGDIALGHCLIGESKPNLILTLTLTPTPHPHTIPHHFHHTFATSHRKSGNWFIKLIKHTEQALSLLRIINPST
ncbi:hypothetical protein SODALDRAFT_354424 [Sodiomyces alkalinus F11]|uniref:Uncharacterized protein n=1 Tax=Sodiomyces alkalinus (strain CBS 110278 / VKM F-3762 / F11) TaxID=1314773 RepID=A0A3N2Q6Q4_SODAK|nr:hypothetical protein SODALDRAFT_354424 [Sodiomyces alkalinus F11]ROT42295.1 hypothetical protein SODALDRAFT_354424 [Sodiomyces alkalinus F11]